MTVSTRTAPRIRLFALTVLSLGLLLAPGAAPATTAAGRPVAWGCGTGGDLLQCRVPIPSGVTAIAAGYAQSLALKSDGTVVAWGCGRGRDVGQCSVPSGLAGVTAIAAGFGHSLGLKSDGTVIAWGCGGTSVGPCNVPSGLAGITAVSAGASQSLALKSDGTVLAWGCNSNDYGQCNVPSGLANVTAVSAGASHSLALRSDGTVVAWGCGTGADFGQCSVPSGLSGVTAIAAGAEDSLALKGDGTVLSWGCLGGVDGQCSVPGGLAGVTAIAAAYHSLALKSDGTVVAWGCGNSDVGQCSVPTGLTRVTAISAGDWHSLALVELASQTITFGPLANKTFGAPDFRVSATASSGLVVSFAASGNCTISGATTHLTGAGLCTVTASQPGDANYNPAPDVSQTFSIAPATCRVPKVVGKRLPSAKRTIARRRCRTGKVRLAYSRKRKKGIVISQSRRPGRVLPAGSKISLIVSRGRTR